MPRLQVSCGGREASRCQCCKRLVAAAALPIARDALDALAPRIAALTAPGGRLALSAILAGQEAPLLARYAEWFDGLTATGREDWIRIDAVRRAD
jgi:ribosomal protein L11 methyltransferase